MDWNFISGIGTLDLKFIFENVTHGLKFYFSIGLQLLLVAICDIELEILLTALVLCSFVLTCKIFQKFLKFLKKVWNLFWVPLDLIDGSDIFVRHFGIFLTWEVRLKFWVWELTWSKFISNSPHFTSLHHILLLLLCMLICNDPYHYAHSNATNLKYIGVFSSLITFRLWH